MDVTKRDSEIAHSLLELAAADDLAGFKRAVEEYGANPDHTGSWYCRKYASCKMGWCEMTPAMIASLYGSLQVLKYTLNHISSHDGNINKACGADGGTALHYAAAGSSFHAVETVRLLLSHGADVNVLDAHGMRPFDVMMGSPKQHHAKIMLKRMLIGCIKCGLSSECLGSHVSMPHAAQNVNLEELDDVQGSELATVNADYDPLSSLTLTCLSSQGASIFSPLSSSPASSPNPLPTMSKVSNDSPELTRECAADPTLPDVKNTIYTSDDFRMFSFKVRLCSRAYSHDWTECPFVHSGENARRRDPRKFHYSCVPCPDFRKGACRFGDACEYAHGIFESWLHPAQYRTRLCKDGVNCMRRVCFFAHTKEELRPLYMSSSSAVPSPRVTHSLDASLPLGPASPSSFCMVPTPFSPVQNTPQSGLSTPPMSPSSLKGPWAQPNVPTLHLPGVGGLQASRLRAALNARDACPEDQSRASDFEGQLMGDVAFRSTQARLNAAAAASGCGATFNKAAKYDGHNVSPINLDGVFASEVVCSPRSPLPPYIQSHISNHIQPPRPSHTCSLTQSQLQSRAQMLSPTGTHRQYETVSNLQAQEEVLMQSSTPSSFNVGSPRHVFCMENETSLHSGMKSSRSPTVTANLSHRERRNNGLSWSDWGSPTGKPEWGVHGDDLSRLRKSPSFGTNAMEEPDLTWVQKMVKDGPVDGASPLNMCSVEVGCDGSRDELDSVLGFWLEQMQLDEIMT